MKIFAAILTSCLILLGCKQYSVSLNEKVLYTPAPLFTQFSVADRRLQQCLDQTIKDIKATRAQDVKILNCAHAGIESLEGLRVFSSIEQLNLSNNQIRNISELAWLPRLEVLMLQENTIIDGAPLLNLLHLLHLDVTENPSFDCQITAQLKRNLEQLKPKLVFPQHC
ncbi:MAG: leucine-rich repeat domain-containing protein [Cellvibrio sp.]